MSEYKPVTSFSTTIRDFFQTLNAAILSIKEDIEVNMSLVSIDDFVHKIGKHFLLFSDAISEVSSLCSVY